MEPYTADGMARREAQNEQSGDGGGNDVDDAGRAAQVRHSNYLHVYVYHTIYISTT